MIRYIEENQVFILETKSTQYAMCVRPDGHLEHLYYGGRSQDGGDLNTVGLWDAARDRSLFETGNAIALGGGLTLENMLQELSSTGKGDVSEPFVCMTHANGSTTCDFVYESYEIKNGRDELEGLPCAVESGGGMGEGTGVADGVTQLIVTLRDTFYRQKLELIYVTWDDCDVITRSARLTNESGDVERVDRLMSTQIDMRMYKEYDMIHFGGHGQGRCTGRSTLYGRERWLSHHQPEPPAAGQIHSSWWRSTVVLRNMVSVTVSISYTQVTIWRAVNRIPMGV